MSMCTSKSLFYFDNSLMVGVFSTIDDHVVGEGFGF